MKTKRSLISAAVCVLLFATLGLVIAIDLIFPIRYLSTIKKYCREYSVEVPLVLAVIWAESKFDSNAVSSAGACGLMQLMPSTASWIAEKECGESELFDPEFNIRTGVKYLSYLKSKFGGDYVLAAYNAGEGNVAKWLNLGGEIKFSETRTYIKRVNKVEKLYRLRVSG